MNAADLFHLARLVAESKCDGWERLEDRLRREGEREAAALDPQPVAEPARPINQAEIDMLLGLEETAPGDGGPDGGRERRDAATREDAEKEASASDERTPSNAAPPSTTTSAEDKIQADIREGWCAPWQTCLDHKRCDAARRCERFDIQTVRGEGRGESGVSDGAIREDAQMGSHVASTSETPQSPPPRTIEPQADGLKPCKCGQPCRPQLMGQGVTDDCWFTFVCDCGEEYSGALVNYHTSRATAAENEALVEFTDGWNRRVVSPPKPTPEVAELVKRLRESAAVNQHASRDDNAMPSYIVPELLEAANALERLSSNNAAWQETVRKVIASSKETEAQLADALQQWEPISTLPDLDDECWFFNENSNVVDGPRSPEIDDVDHWTHWCRAEAPPFKSIAATLTREGNNG